jgi:hypothetical protein
MRTRSFEIHEIFTIAVAKRGSASDLKKEADDPLPP